MSHKITSSGKASWTENVVEQHHEQRSSITQNAKSWKTEDEQILPKNNLPLVFFSLLLANFLAALDQTILATALPTIVHELGGGRNYSWVGSAYLLASAALSSFYGKISDIIGRKAVLYPVIVLFLIGSALCGTAQNMTWLIVARAVQGIGGGGILQMVNIVIGDIVPLEKRAQFGGFAGALWGIAAIIGPLVGGALTDHVSWRWCFWVNLPTGGIALAFLFFSLHLNPSEHGKTFREHVADFDFPGLFLILSGVICLLLGFSESESSWSSPATIALLAVGGVLLLGAGFWEGYTDRSPIIPPRLFRTRTTGLILIAVFLHGFAFFAASYYLPVYYQVLGASATRAGVQVFPYSLGSCVVSLSVGLAISAMGGVRQVVWTSFFFMTIGYGLMTMLDEKSSTALQVVYTLIAGMGEGGLFFPPLVLLQAAMPAKDMATATATLGLLRQLGSTVGISIGQAIWSTDLRRRLAIIPGVTIDSSSANVADSIRQINNIQPESLRQAVQHAYTKSISLIWIVDTPLIGLCFILVLFLKNYSLKRKAVTDEEKAAQSGEDSSDADASPARTLREDLDEEKPQSPSDTASVEQEALASINELPVPSR